MRSALLCLAVLVCVYAKDQSASGTGARVDFVGSSGKMKIYPSDAKDAPWIMVSMGHLTETGNGATNAITSFASQDFAWSDPVSQTVDNVATTYVAFDSTLAVGKGGSVVNVPFKVETWLYQETGTAKNGNQTVEVRKDSLKFTVSIASWPFENPLNELTFGINIDTKGGKSEATKEQKSGKKEASIGFGEDGSLDVSQTAIVDGVEKDIVVNTVGGKGKVTVEFTFPHFANTLKYDPVLTAAASMTQAASVVVAAFALLAVLAQ